MTCEDTHQFCMNCGAPLVDTQVAPAPEYYAVQTQAADEYPRARTKSEFLKLPENQAYRSSIKSAGIVCYVSAGLTLLVGFLLDTFPYNLLDVMILVGLGLGIHLGKSRVCAILLCAYATLSALISISQNGKISGIIVIMAGVYAVVNTFKAESAWKNYQRGA